MPKTLLDYVQKEIEPTVYCQQWKREVPLKKCLEHCNSQCTDVEQLVQAQKRLAVRYS